MNSFRVGRMVLSFFLSENADLIFSVVQDMQCQ